MAPKSKIRLVDQPPSASSSDEEEDQSEQEQSEQEVENSEAEYVSESEEDDDQIPSTPILNRKSHDDGEEESESESQGTQPSPSASDFTVKPIVSSKPPLPSPPKVPSAKAIEKDSKKKRSKTGEGDGQSEEKKSAASAGSNRLWSDEDQIAMLQGMVDYAQKGADAYADMSAFHGFIKEKLSVEVTKVQMTEKLRRLKKKFLTIYEKGDDFFLKPHDSMCYQLSKQIWGPAKNLNAIGNQAEPNVKIANGKVKKLAEVKKISDSKKSVKVDTLNEEEPERKRKKSATKAEENEKKKRKKQRIAMVEKDKQIAIEEKEEKGEQSALEEKDDQTVVEEKDKHIAPDERDKQIAIDERDKIDLEDKNKQIATKDIVNGEVKTEERDFKSKYPHLANSFSKKNYPLSSEETLDMLKEKLNLIGSSNAEEIEDKWTKLWEEQAELCGKMTDLLAQQIKLVLDAIKN